jgi:hypothetical protein
MIPVPNQYPNPSKWSEWQDLNLRPPRPERDRRELSPCKYGEEPQQKPRTAQEHPAISVPYLCQAFEDWLDQQVLPLEIAEHANRILRYLRMAEEKSLPACLRAALAEHVAAVSSGRL